MVRISCSSFPHYFAILSRIKEEVRAIGNEGGKVTSSHEPHVQAFFPKGNFNYKLSQFTIYWTVKITIIWLFYMMVFLTGRMNVKRILWFAFCCIVDFWDGPQIIRKPIYGYKQKVSLPHFDLFKLCTKLPGLKPDNNSNRYTLGPLSKVFLRSKTNAKRFYSRYISNRPEPNFERQQS